MMHCLCLLPQPEELARHDNSNGYCKFNDQILQLFTSSLFLAGAFAALVGMVTCKKYGRRFTMVMGGFCFIIGRGFSALKAYVVAVLSKDG
jgi:hypothetical protein